MGNVACCKKPNEIIDDKDLLKQKSTMRRNELLNNNIICQENPFLKTNHIEKPIINLNINANNINSNANTIDEENKIIIDLERNNIEHQATNGPSDNMRRRKQKNIQNEKHPSKDVKYNENINNKKLKEQNMNINEFNKVDELREKQLICENKIIENDTNIKNININSNKNMNINLVNGNNINLNNINANNNTNNYKIQNNLQINNNVNNNKIQNNQLDDDNNEKSPMDNKRKNRNNNILKDNNINTININKDIDGNNQLSEPRNSDDNNYPQKRLENQNIISVEQNHNDLQEKNLEENNKYFIHPTNQSIEFINNSNYIPKELLSKVSNNINSIQPQSQIQPPQNQVETKIQSQKSNKNNEELNNNPEYNQLEEQNEQLEEDQIPQNSPIEKGNYDSQDKNPILENGDIQVEEEVPKDSNEVYQKPNLEQGENMDNNDENDNENDNENENIDNNDNSKDIQIKEAFIQNPDGKIYPTKQLSDSEIAVLYNQCLSKGETEPDDDFSPETYKQFYPENDPFFIFDKGEVSQGQIITSPEDINHLEIYEGEINENNKKHGFGISTTPLYVRKGDWRNGEFTGWGRESRRNKDVLEGKFINGKVNGKGFLKNNRGNLYVGEFVNSQREGYGELQTNKIHYIGEFKADQLNGKGIIEFLKE